MGSSYRWGQKSDEEAILDLANMVFSMDDEPHDFSRLIPKVYGQPGFAEKHIVCADKQSRLLAMAALQPETLRVGEGSLRLGLVGTVCVHPRHRRRGHMTHMMPLVEARAREQACDVLVLGGQRQRYSHFGYAQAGASVRMDISADNLRHIGVMPGEVLRFVRLEQAPDSVLSKVYGLFSGQSMVCEREPHAFAAILRTWMGQGYAVLEGENPIGYVYTKKGHWWEFAFADPAMISQAISAWQRVQRLENTRLTIGLHQRDMLSALGAIAENTTESDTLMVKVLNWQRVLQRLLSFRNAILPVEEANFILEIDEERLRIQASSHGVLVHVVQDRPMVSMTHSQAVATLLSVQSAWQPQAAAFHDWLPLWFSLPSADGF